ncbi:hypothetical protein RRG08_004318 [Elysia crispata]|uniref:Uncharacterized protein n=1 Tax=Elysia crispata TaxID=231223 RepID=A0AAE1CVZ5_9GAST|nr:hypothetical protein RRG08_004318 [Elysia crispata]
MVHILEKTRTAQINAFLSWCPEKPLLTKMSILVTGLTHWSITPTSPRHPLVYDIHYFDTHWSMTPTSL